MVKIMYLLAAGIIFMAGQASGHGYMAIPKSRNYLHNSNYCPHCLNGGGVGATRGTVYPKSGPHGVCGDPANSPRDHEAGGKFATGEVTGIYEDGGLIHLAAAMSTYHKGMIEYRICRFPAGLSTVDEKNALTEECLDQHILKQADIPGAQVPNGRYYFLGNASDTGFYPPKLFYHTFQLPQGLVCDGVSAKCVIQMHWVTGNSCNDPQIPQEYRLKYLSTCGQQGSWPEEFWNCADIKILQKGKDGVTKPDPSWPAFTPALAEGSTGNEGTDPYYGNSPSPGYSPSYQSPQYVKPPRPPKALKPPRPPKAMKPPKPPKSPKVRSLPPPSRRTQLV
jgi:hypothetical protein